jgi:hypothetical protein
MRAHFSAALRSRLQLPALLCTVVLTLGLSSPAQAADGCNVLLCLAGNWKNISQCRPPVAEMMRDVARGRHFPGCDSGGNSAAANRAIAASECPLQYRTETMAEGTIEYLCPFSSVIDVAVEGRPWCRTWWSPSGDSVTEWLPAARAAFAANPTEIDERFAHDYVAWVAAQEAARIAAEEAARQAGGGA